MSFSCNEPPGSECQKIISIKSNSVHWWQEVERKSNYLGGSGKPYGRRKGQSLHVCQNWHADQMTVEERDIALTNYKSNTVTKCHG